EPGYDHPFQHEHYLRAPRVRVRRHQSIHVDVGPCDGEAERVEAREVRCSGQGHRRSAEVVSVPGGAQLRALEIRCTDVRIALAGVSIHEKSGRSCGRTHVL
ncbi:uncharacterized protein J3R85_016307, partial [Psidium guajava]